MNINRRSFALVAAALALVWSAALLLSGTVAIKTLLLLAGLASGEENLFRGFVHERGLRLFKDKQMALTYSNVLQSACWAIWQFFLNGASLDSLMYMGGFFVVGLALQLLVNKFESVWPGVLLRYLFGLLQVTARI